MVQKLCTYVSYTPFKKKSLVIIVLVFHYILLNLLCYWFNFHVSYVSFLWETSWYKSIFIFDSEDIN